MLPPTVLESRAGIPPSCAPLPRYSNSDSCSEATSSGLPVQCGGPWPSLNGDAARQVVGRVLAVVDEENG